MIQYDMRIVSLLFTLILSTGAPPAQSDALSVRIGDTRVAFSADDVRALPQRTVTVPEDGGTSRYEGPRLADILVRAGATLGPGAAGGGLTLYVVARAPDGFRAVLSLAEIDPDYTDRDVILALRRNDAPLLTDDGPFRLIVSGDRRRTRWVRQVAELTLLTAPDVK